MTVEEAKKILERDLSVQKENKALQDGIIAMEVAITALEEIQQYRALEEKLSGITVKKVVEHFIKTVENQTEEEYTKGRILTNKEAEEWEQLKAIGTVSELRELKEKATAKMPIYSDFDENGEVDENGEEVIIPYKAVCPACGYEFEFGTWNDEQNHHCECGQRMLWG